MWKVVLLLSLLVLSLQANKCKECEESVKNSSGVKKCVRKDGCCPKGVGQVNCFVNPCQTSTAYKCVASYCADNPCGKYEYDQDLNPI
ncbi:unnamed protein product [Bursaphelenchus okinawaensis]|uniref:Uncharacterized protein n=1 Tax=Bursaphelenchus okinawaensis TaxID=465554 RepID=A0A811KWB9_9BILA|nr:unnamed protein product [Bursaphelenchus okinawaensis]CAG9112971.1 unnamed protein product [Bursaphelenchus okinawaensis]